MADDDTDPTGGDQSPDQIPAGFGPASQPLSQDAISALATAQATPEEDTTNAEEDLIKRLRDDATAPRDDTQFKDMFDKLQQKQDEYDKRAQGILAEERSGTKSMIGSLEESRQNIVNMPPPKLQDMPKAPQAALGQGSMEWMQSIALIGAMGGAFIRRGTTSALTAFAGAVQGFAQGREKDFNAKADEWKIASEQVKADNQARLDQYNSIMANEKLSMDIKLGQLKMASSAWSDEMMYNMAASKNVAGTAALLQRQMQQNDTFQQRQDAKAIAVTRLQELVERRKTMENEAHQMAEGIISGMLPPDTASMGNYGGRNIVMGDIAKATKEGRFNLSDAKLQWLAASNIVKNVDSNRVVQLMGTAQAALENMDELKRLAIQMKNGNVPLVNQAKMMKEVGLKANTPEGRLATRYIAVVNALKNELPLLESGGFAPHEAHLESVKAQLDQNMGSKQMIDAMDELKKVLRTRINAIPYISTYGPRAQNRYTGSQGTMDQIFGPGGAGANLANPPPLPQGTTVEEIQ